MSVADGQRGPGEGSREVTLAHGVEVERHPIVVSGEDGLEQLVQAGGVWFRYQMVRVGSRFYWISVKGSRDQVDEADVQVFLATFAAEP
jgi:hypothetical protein